MRTCETRIPANVRYSSKKTERFKPAVEQTGDREERFSSWKLNRFPDRTDRRRVQRKGPQIQLPGTFVSVVASAGSDGKNGIAST